LTGAPAGRHVTHETMECSICFDAISAETGVTTTSCGHSYHLSCISTWYAQQGVTQSCPFCRKEMSGKEVLALVRSDDDSDSEDEEEDEVIFTREELNNFLVARGGSGLTDAMATAICANYGAFTLSELRVLSVGNGGRELNQQEWDALIDGDESDTESDWDSDAEVDADTDAETVAESVAEPQLTICLTAESGEWSRAVTQV